MRLADKFLIFFIIMIPAMVMAQAASGGAAAAGPPKEQPSQVDAAADRIFYQEAKLVENMHQYNPLVETYIQNLKPDKDLGAVPANDKYFLGRLVLNEKGIADRKFEDRNQM